MISCAIPAPIFKKIFLFFENPRPGSGGITTPNSIFRHKLSADIIEIWNQILKNRKWLLMESATKFCSNSRKMESSSHNSNTQELTNSTAMQYRPWFTAFAYCWLLFFFALKFYFYSYVYFSWECEQNFGLISNGIIPNSWKFSRIPIKYLIKSKIRIRCRYLIKWNFEIYFGVNRLQKKLFALNFSNFSEIHSIFVNSV